MIEGSPTALPGAMELVSGVKSIHSEVFIGRLT